MASPTLPSTTLEASDGRDPAYAKLLASRKCSCGRNECGEVIHSYFINPASPYPDPAAPKLLFDLINPQANPETRKKKQAARRQQLFDRAIKLLHIRPGIKRITIAIHHFHRDVIRTFSSDHNRGSTIFLDYLLPSDMVANSRLGVTFTAIDKLICLETNAEDKQCKKAAKTIARERPGSCLKKVCTCNRYLNVPFVTLD